MDTILQCLWKRYLSNFTPFIVLVHSTTHSPKHTMARSSASLADFGDLKILGEGAYSSVYFQLDPDDAI